MAFYAYRGPSARERGPCRAGETQLATTVARRFCNLFRKSGAAENFNARTGEPLRDRAYTWTSSVFFVLAHELLR